MTIALRRSQRVHHTFADGLRQGRVSSDREGPQSREIHGEDIRSTMPSQLHDVLVQLFRNRPLLAPELLRDALNVELPQFTEARIDSADLTDVQPAEYRADLVVLLLDGKPVLGIVIEVQLSRENRKRFVWPVYAATLRARWECPVCVLVMTVDEAIARWAAKPVEMGNGSRFVPLVLRPSGVPEVTDEAQAQSDPERAVLSAMAHGNDEDTHKAAQIALAARSAILGLDPERSKLYFDLVDKHLSEAARRALQAMDLRDYEYQSDFARRYVAEGKAIGEANGRAALVKKLLVRRFGSLTQQADARITSASIAELDEIAERLLTAQSLQEALG
jgi:uncharacterized protein DUF4351